MDHPTHSRATPAACLPAPSQLADWLLGRGDAPPAERLRAAGVAPYAYTALSPGHPGRAALQTDYLCSVTRSACVRSQLLPLLHAWGRAGVPALLFKGFHLGEFVYPVPGARTYSDVDVLLRPGSDTGAVGAAERARWRVDYDPAELGEGRFHTAFELRNPHTGLSVDVHRFAVPGAGLRARRRLTDAVWAHARPRTWEGVQVWEMDPVDALLVGLVLGRSWSADGWGIRPHDVLDWRLLGERCGVCDPALEARARELGCARTLRLFRERLDPARGRAELGPPPRSWVRRARVLTAPECRPLGAALLRAAQAPRVAAEVAAALPYVYRARRAVRALDDLPALLRSLAPHTPAAPSTRAERLRTARGVRWAARLLRTTAGCDCLVRSVALFSALREQGWPVHFVSGTQVEQGRAATHHWVELDGRVLPEPHASTGRTLCRESFRYP